MKFKSLVIQYGMFKNTFSFDGMVTLVHSDKNSVGKSTLLRFLLYGLGYAIPGTKGLNFKKFEITTTLKNDFNKDITLIRNGASIVYVDNFEEINYSLPSDIVELHQKVFGIENYDVLDNLLGVFYVDQEKGWTLLNRGKVIGGIQFNIERFILGLSNKSNTELSEHLSIINRELSKYKQMLDVSEYQAELVSKGENFSYDAPVDEVELSIEQLLNEKKPLEIELSRVKSVIRKNTSFKKYISGMKLIVRSNSDEEIPVNEETIVGFKDTVDYIIAKRHMIEAELAKLNNKISNLKKVQYKEETLFNIQTVIQSFDADISKISINAYETKKIIANLEKKKKSLEVAKTDNLKKDNPLIAEMHKMISSYALELGIDEKYVSPSKDYIFTSDLKSLTGAVLHKIVFSFKVSYIKIVEKYTGVVLPIILDSPSGRELDSNNINEMIGILQRDFSNHQIIIASIHDYGFTDENIIEIKDRLLSM